MRMRSFMKIFTAVLIAFTLITSLHAGDKGEKATPFQYSIFNPIQLFSEDYNVYGVRLNLLYGVNNSIYGVDLGGYSRTTGDFYGVQAAVVVAMREQDCSAVTMAGIANLSLGDDGGAAFAGFMNVASGQYTGLQAACINHARKFTGVQLGALNHCDDFKGFQFGLINICKDQSLPFTILINFRF